MSEHKERSGYNPWVLLPAIPLLMAVSVYLGQEAYKHGLDVTFNPTILIQSKKELSASQAATPDSSSTHDQMRIINRFINIKRSYEKILNLPLSLEETNIATNREVVNFIQAQGRQHFLDGVAIAGLILPPDQARSTYITPDAIFIEGEPYNLDNLFQRSLGSSILEFRFEEKYSQLLIENENRDYQYGAEIEGISLEQYKQRHFLRSSEPKSFEPEVALLKWLKGADRDITIDDDAWGILPSDYIVTMAKTLKTFDNLGLPLPPHIRFVRFDKSEPFAGWYKGHTWSNPFAITITTEGSKDTFIHEAGHFLSDAWALPNPEQAKKMKDFSQISFTQFVWPEQGKDPQETKEVYAEAVRNYLLYGSSTRYFANEDSESGNIEKRKYQFISQLFSGMEFADNMEPITTNPDYKPGIKVQVFDKDQKRPGVLLRPDFKNPYLGLSPDLPAIFDGDEVILWERKTVDTSQNKATVVWEVVTKNGERGWVDQKWLGSVILPN